MGHTIFGYANENRATKTKSFRTVSWWSNSDMVSLHYTGWSWIFNSCPKLYLQAITFYIQNFIESQMAIGRTMIFADYPFIFSFGCAISIYKEAETRITRPFRFVSPIRIQPFFILPSFPSFLLPDKDCNTDTPTPLCQFFVLRPFPPRSLYAYCLYGVSSLPLQIMRYGIVSRLKFF